MPDPSPSILNKPKKKNFFVNVFNSVSMTIEYTLTSTTNVPTISIDLREPDQAKRGCFNNATKVTFQLDPYNELSEFLSVLLTYKAQAEFGYHGQGNNKSLKLDWQVKGDNKGDVLRLSIMNKGVPRYILINRAKVFEMSMVVANRVADYLDNSFGVGASRNVSLSDIEHYVGRAFRPFKQHTIQMDLPECVPKPR